MSLAQVLRELVAEKAAEVRRAKRPAFGIVSVDGVSLSELSWQDEDAPARGD